jgi:hypothetical protein
MLIRKCKLMLLREREAFWFDADECLGHWYMGRSHRGRGKMTTNEIAC